MEAVALWDFNASQSDEMSFRKSERLCVVNMEDKDWYKAVKGPNSGLIPAAYIRMEPNDWFQSPMTRAEAEAYLLKRNSIGAFIHEDGNFLIRKSESDANGFSLSVKHEESVQHFKILKDGNNKFYIWTTSSLSINELVAKYHDENVSGDPRRIIVLKDMKQEFYEAMYDFAPANDEELGLTKGDVIRLIAKPDDNWWEGEIGGRSGFFPKTYVKEYKP